MKTKRTVLRMLLAIAVMLLLGYGFQQGMEWHRIGCVALGGIMLGGLALTY